MASTIAPATRSPFVARAWWALAATPVGLGIAMVVGEGLATALGYESGSQELAPLPVMLAAGLPASAILATAPTIALLLARRALAAGDGRARLPMTLAIITLALLAAQLLLGLAQGVIASL